MKYLKIIFSIALIVLYTYVCYGHPFDIEPSSDISGQKDIAILDLRTTEVFKKGHIQGAINVPFEFLYTKFLENRPDFFRYLSALGVTPDKQIVLVTKAYDKDDITHQFALMGILSYGGFNKVFILKGGIVEWQRRKLHLQKVGTEILPKSWKYQFRSDFFYKPQRKIPTKKRKKEVLINLGKHTSEFKPFKNVITIPDISIFFNEHDVKSQLEIDAYLKELKVSSENVLIIYPWQLKETYFLAFLLKYYVGFNNVVIFNGGKD